MIHRSQVRLLVRHCYAAALGTFFTPCTSVIKHNNLVLAKWQRCSVAGTVTAGQWVGKDISPCLCYIACWLLQLCFVFGAEEGQGQVAACSKRCSTSVWSLGPRNMRLICLVGYMATCTGWLFLSKCSTSLLWQSIIFVSTEFQGTSPTPVCQSRKFLITSICDLPDVINCPFHEFAVAPLRPVHCLLPDQQSANSLPDHLQDPAVDSKQFRRTWNVSVLWTFEPLAH